MRKVRGIGDSYLTGASRPGRVLCLLLAILLVLAVPAAGYGESAGPTENDSAVQNRHIAVDLTGRTRGYSAVLYDNRNGLPTSEANAIAETSDGFIWIGSYAGLIRYDGNTFERMGTSSGISSIKCLYVDSRDRLWMGTNDMGIAVMEKGEFRLWGKLDGLKSAHTRAITEDRNGTIYIATTCGIAAIDSDYNLTMLEDDLIAEANMRFMIMGADGLIYGLTNLGDIMTLKDGRLLNYIPAGENTVSGAVGAFYPDMDEPGMVYLQTVDYPFCHARMGEALTDLVEIDIQPLTTVQMISSFDGKLWICASNGIGYVEKGEFHLLENLPMNTSVGGVMMDYLGNLWFTSTRQGVMKIVPNQFFDLFEQFDLPTNVVNTTCLCEDRLFVGTDTGLMILDSNGPVSSFPLTKATTVSGEDLGFSDLIEMLDGCRIRSIIRDSKGRAWISVWRQLGLLRYSQGEVVAFTQNDGLLSGSLRAVGEQEDGSILVAVAGGVNVIEGDRVVAAYGEEEGIVNTESLTVAEGLNGEIVLGSNGGGLYIIDDAGVKNINVEDGLPSDGVMRLKRDKAHNVIWIVCSSGIAYMTPDNQVTTIREFPYTNNFDLYENSHGDMWVLSSNGIYVTPIQELLANGKNSYVYYSLANGLPCITTANSYSELTDDGDLYIAGSTGVCKVNIDQTFEVVNDLKAVVPFVEADGKTFYPDETGAFTIPESTRKLTIFSFVFNYSLSDPQVSLQLEGFEQHSTTFNRSDMVPIDYTNLRGGTYRYVMQLKDTLGRSNKVVSVQITKEKAFYEEVWFYIVASLAALVLLALIVRFMVHQQTRKLVKKQKETMALVGGITEAFAKVIDMKDKYTNGHSSRVARYTAMLARELGIDEETVEKYYRIALLHDIGKVGVPQEILNKNGKLTDEEFDIIKSHTSQGYEALKQITIMPELAIGAQAHHERPDGHGYPNHLKGDEIPRVAQIIAVADCFDAMYSDRPYRKRMDFDKVVSIIREVSGSQLTPDVVDAFLRLVEQGEFRDPDDVGGGSTENIENIRE
ncbi:MAG: HD domain-containing protein [Oscillospiraceae bacterium]|nr:HD domain-containing protein [Oscillospiraceae bacterium]